MNSGESAAESKTDGSDKQQETETQSADDVETLFASKTHERLLGLLGAILPQDSKVQPWFNVPRDVKQAAVLYTTL